MRTEIRVQAKPLTKAWFCFSASSFRVWLPVLVSRALAVWGTVAYFPFALPTKIHPACTNNHTIDLINTKPKPKKKIVCGACMKPAVFGGRTLRTGVIK